MVKAVEYAVRNSAGVVVRGAVDGGGFVQVGSGEMVSLNLSPTNVVGYQRDGSALIVRLADGSELTLSGFFDYAPNEMNRLYLSTDGQIAEVFLTDGPGGAQYASYGPAEGFNKFSALDDLRFDGGETLTLVEGSTEPAGMGPFVPGLIGLGGGLGTAALVGGGLTLVGGGGGGGGGGSGGGRRPPTVDDPTSISTVTTNTPTPQLVVTGSGQPGDTVQVTIGNLVATTTITAEGTWSVSVPRDRFPPDGSYETVVVFTHQRGNTTTLDGPGFIIDMTPPAVAVTEGTQGSGDIENAAAHTNGVQVGGTGEAGASIRVEINGQVQTTSVAANGTWTVSFTTTQLPGGEYTAPVKVTATDLYGNTTVVNDTLIVDTVPHPISIATVAGDNVVNGAEASAGFAIAGSTTAGATVSVAIGTITRTVTAGADGSWSIALAPGALPAGEYDATITASTVDGAGNASSTTRTIRIDTATAVSISGPVAGDDVVNATEAAGGVTLTGTAQPGAAVQVAWAGATLPATAGADGRWSVTFPGAAIAGGEYASTATVTATDAAGNTAQAGRAVRVDTTTSVSVDPGQAGGDDIVSGTERGAGLALTGRAEAGAAVAVTFEGVTRSVTAGADGAWTATFAPGEVRQGTYASTVSVRATDAAGNVASTTHALSIDTEVKPLTRNTLSTGQDQILNAAEAASGLTVTGTVEPGSAVAVRFGSGQSRNATVAADGTWTLTIPANEVPAGEKSVALNITATDRVGNVATLSEQVQVDTVVRNFARTGGAIGGDGVLNATEVAAGLPLSGTVEPGATVVVRLSNGATQTATAGADGAWSVTFPGADLPRGETGVTATLTATDRAGNVATLTDSFRVDTVAPGSPEVVSFSRDAAGLRAIGTETTTDIYSFHRVDASGTRTEIPATRTEDTVFGETNFRFSASVPDGSYLVVNTADAAGNTSSTLLIVDNTNAANVNLSRPGLANFDFTAIDLTWAPDSQLTITESQLTALTGPDQRLIVKGDADDTVTMTGAVATGQAQMIDGQRYAVYTLGAGGTVLLDDDIRAVL